MAATFTHLALFYRNDDDYVRGVGRFLEDGLAARAALFVAVPAGRIKLLQAELGGVRKSVRFADMEQLGANPARIIPAISAFLTSSAGRAVRFVGEPIWSSRSDDEIVEATRHEALINPAFANADASILCPYDLQTLDPGTLLDAERTHPTLVSGDGAETESATFEPLEVYAAADHPLPPPAGPVRMLPLTGDLGRFRQLVYEYVSPLLAPVAVEGFLVATNEVASNTLVHAGGRGAARIWHDDREVGFEIADRGEVLDPLVGRWAPGVDDAGGRGLWLVNQICDLVELRSGSAGTVTRLHMRRPAV